MTRPRIERRIFVVGVPRSGTTLVQSLLAAHSQVTSFTESHFFSRHFKALPRWSAAILTRDPAPRLHEFLVENGVEPAGVAESIEERVRGAVPAGFLLPLATRAVARQLLRVLDELALLQGKSTWIEKTPRHLRYVPFLERLSDPARPPRFVHVIRNGLDVVASLHKASQSWERPYDLETCVERWNADVGFSLRRASAPTDHFVFYEELTARPHAALERLLAGLGLDWEPEILERYSSRRLTTPEETWKAGVDHGVRRSGTSEQVLTEAQRDRARASLRHELYTQLRERTS